MITVADLIAYRRRTERLVERVVATKLPTAFGEFTAVGYRSLLDEKHHVAMVKGNVSGRRGRARSRALRVPHRRRLPLASLRLRRAARGGDGDDRAAGLGGAALPLPGGARDRPAQQAARLQASGGGARHRRREPQARPAGRPARLRDRRPDPGRPRPDQHPHPDQQPEEDPRARGLRALGRRAGPDPVDPQPSQRGVPEREARQDGPRPAPPGPAARRGADPRRARARRGTWWTEPTASTRSASRPSTRTWRAARQQSHRGVCRPRRQPGLDPYVRGARGVRAPLRGEAVRGLGPLRRGRLPRRGDPRRDRPLRVRLHTRPRAGSRMSSSPPAFPAPSA